MLGGGGNALLRREKGAKLTSDLWAERDVLLRGTGGFLWRHDVCFVVESLS